ncbi:MAG TPA: CDC48 family AAA ATPase [archaeon]|jgi:transitional endoplasmic reticulum ATPase|nr:CDC48 family AAA ATPase [archaeon]
MVEQKAKLIVRETEISDVGKDIVKIDPVVFDKMGLSVGDTIKIQGIKTDKATIAYALKGKVGDTGLNTIKMDATIRFNSGCKIDDEVFIEKIACQIAQSVTLAPPVEIPDLKRNDVVSYVHDKIINKNILENNIVVIRGIKIMLNEESRDLQLTVTKSFPKGAVKITDTTKIIISEKPLQTNNFGITYDDIGGLKKEIESIREMVELPIKRPEVFKKLGITAPKGILLYGPPGTGKTLLAKAVASETDSNFTIVNGPEIVAGTYGKSEENLRNIFAEAEKNAPAIIFIDEIDSIAPKRENIHGETEKRIVAQLLTLMDGLKSRGDVIVIGATNIPDAVDPALRRPGRFDREFEIGIPSKEARKEIFMVHTRGMPLTEDVDINEILEMTNGFSGADISALCKEAALKALKRLMPKINKEYGNELSKEIMDELVIKRQDFLDALNIVEPSAIREIMVSVPNTKWSAVGGLEDIKQELKEMIEWPMKHKDLFEKVGITAPRGVLLYGPPGTGKTLLAKAIATETNANFISIKGPEVFNKWVGESEKKIRDIFKKARQLAPSIVFIDEIDSITSGRSGLETNDAKNNVVAQLLTEIDGVSNLKDIVIVGATNRPDLIDPAFLRPGRFEKLLLVPLPDELTREKIFEVYLSKMTIDKKTNAKELAKLTEGFSGAEIEAVCREAGLTKIRLIIEDIEKDNKLDNKKPTVTKDAFLKAIEKFKSKKETKEEKEKDYAIR